MYKLAYYFVPINYVFFSNKQKDLLELDLTNWIQINIGDSLEDRKEKSSWEKRTQFAFVDDPYKVAQLLWEIKENDEDIFFKYKTHRFKKTYKVVSVNSVENLGKHVSRAQSISHGFLYKKKKSIRKFINISQGEIIELYARKEYKVHLEAIISKWAVKTDYYTYELDLYDD